MTQEREIINVLEQIIVEKNKSLIMLKDLTEVQEETINSYQIVHKKKEKYINRLIDTINELTEELKYYQTMNLN
mgnify:CR=1 FL=1